MLVVMIGKLELWVILFFQTPPHLSTDNPVFKNKKKKSKNFQKNHKIFGTRKILCGIIYIHLMNRASYISHKTGTIWTLPTFFHDKNIFQRDPLGFLRLNVPKSLVHYKTRGFTQRSITRFKQIMHYSLESLRVKKLAFCVRINIWFIHVCLTAVLIFSKD